MASALSQRVCLPHRQWECRQLQRIVYHNRMQQLSLTPFDVTSKPTPSGMKTMPTAMKIGITVPAVIIGCHALNFCCLNRVSKNKVNISPIKEQLCHIHFVTHKPSKIKCHLGRRHYSSLP